MENQVTTIQCSRLNIALRKSEDSFPDIFASEIVFGVNFPDANKIMSCADFSLSMDAFPLFSFNDDKQDYVIEIFPDDNYIVTVYKEASDYQGVLRERTRHKETEHETLESAVDKVVDLMLKIMKLKETS